MTRERERKRERRIDYLPQKHWKAHKKINCIKQGANFVHGSPIQELIIRKLHVINADNEYRDNTKNIIQENTHFHNVNMYVTVTIDLLTFEIAKVSRYAIKYERARIQAALKSHCVFSGK